MKKIRCIKCGNEKVLNEKCSYCGFLPKKGINIKYFIIPLCLIPMLFIGSFFFSGSQTNTNEIKKQKTYTSLNAYRFAEGFVKKKLKSPKTAEFPSIYEKNEHVTSIGDNEFKIYSWVDSQNSYGALIRTKFSCIIIFDKGNVSVKELNFIE